MIELHPPVIYFARVAESLPGHPRTLECTLFRSNYRRSPPNCRNWIVCMYNYVHKIYNTSRYVDRPNSFIAQNN
jgi:hypothetical protein